jgi:hypothetical protein
VFFSGRRWFEFGVISDHGVEGDEAFSGDGDDGGLGFASRVAEPVVEGLEDDEALRERRLGKSRMAPRSLAMRQALFSAMENISRWSLETSIPMWSWHSAMAPVLVMRGLLSKPLATVQDG